MKKQRSKSRPSKQKPKSKRPGKFTVSQARATDAKAKPRKRIESVTGEVGAERWRITRRSAWYNERGLADAWDIKQIQTDLGALAGACDRIRDLAEEQANRLDDLEPRLDRATAAAEKLGQGLAAQLDALSHQLDNGTISQTLQALCKEQLREIDERIGKLTALEARVRGLVKNLKS